jgi:hypothetical protein
LLFLAEEGTSWRPLHRVTRDPGRNFLHNHFGQGEDDPEGSSTLLLEPDCADAPYFLRAYFSAKVGLPFGHLKCDRGSRSSPPRCADFHPYPAAAAGARWSHNAMASMFRGIAGTVQSASARTMLEDDDTDLYPLALTRRNLRPGTVYADPYGHTLMIAAWRPQSPGQPGTLLAVDAQPDGTVTVKRFWRGNFLFVTEGIIGQAGFKAFRPVVRRAGQRAGGWSLQTNEEILANPDYGNVSLEQATLTATAFYDRMEGLINPEPLDPTTAYRQLHDALHEQLGTRVTAIENGEAYFAATPETTIPMPSGIAIFQTSGPWEDYSTPSRDLRLLVAIDALLDFPDRLTRTPEAFALGGGRTVAKVREELAALHESWGQQLSISYLRSDGTRQTLTLGDVLDRAAGLEMGYNPNDCPEIRWGAPAASAELASCRRQAPPEQRKRMEKMRVWFRDRRRPAW